MGNNDTTHAEYMANARAMYRAHHDMFRREFGLLPGLILSVPVGDTKRARVVADHVDLLSKMLRAYHEGEDAIMWPRLLERGGREAAAIVPAMRDQQETLERLLAEADEMLPGWRLIARGGADLALVFDHLLNVLTEHLALEEKEVLPRAEKCLTRAEWKDLGECCLGALTRSELPLTVGLAMYESDPAVVKNALKEAPLSARILVPLIGPRAFAVHSKRVHGTATPPRSTDGSRFNRP
jgi:type IV secretory pathway VirJ component